MTQVGNPEPPPSYAEVLRLPGVKTPFLASLLGRLSYAMLPLALIITVQHETGSYAAAGAATAAFGIASTLMPVKARLIDRFGKRLVPMALGVCFLVAVAVMAALGFTKASSEATYIVVAAAAGLAAPPIGPTMRALWIALARSPGLLQRAYSLDASAEELLWLAGPLLTGVVVAAASGPAALVAVAILAMLGSVGLAAAKPAAQSDEGAERGERHFLGPFRSKGFTPLVGVLLIIGICFGPIELAVVARAQHAGHTSVAAVLLAVMAASSAAGGLYWGRLEHRRGPMTQLGGLILLVAAGVGLIAVTDELWVIPLALILAGLASSPAMIIAYISASESVADAYQVEATTWLNTVSNGGLAIGAAGAGALIDGWGVGRTLAIGMCLLLATSAALLLRDRTTGAAVVREAEL